jgi:hypothetical protein
VWPPENNWRTGHCQGFKGWFVVFLKPSLTM